MEKNRGTPRCPTTSESQDLAWWLHEKGHAAGDASDFAEAAYVAVFDDYMTDCPGYMGKVMFVVWPASPTMFDVFVWDDGQFRRESREYDEKACDRCGKSAGTLCYFCWQEDS